MHPMPQAPVQCLRGLGASRRMQANGLTRPGPCQEERLETLQGSAPLKPPSMKHPAAALPVLQLPSMLRLPSLLQCRGRVILRTCAGGAAASAAVSCAAAAAAVSYRKFADRGHNRYVRSKINKKEISKHSSCDCVRKNIRTRVRGLRLGFELLF